MKESELERWNKLSFQYMTEESDDDNDTNVIISHKLEWRSESEDKYNSFSF